MSDLLKFTIPGKPEYVQAIKMAVGSAAGSANFCMEAIEDIEIAVAEACKNIACHGAEGFCHTYQVTCEIQEERMIIIVRDSNSGDRLEKLIKPCLDCPNEGDLAVFVIKSLMDEIEINNESKDYRSIKMVKNKC